LIKHRIFACLFSALAACSFVSDLSAQGLKVAPRAPLPAQIASAKRVFISYAGGIVCDINPDDRVYDWLYAELKGWGRYQIVAQPMGADLILEISAMSVVGPVGTLESPTVGNYPRVRLLVIDPQTHVVLWGFNQHADLHGGAFSAYIAFDEAVGKLVNDLKALDARARRKDASDD